MPGDDDAREMALLVSDVKSSVAVMKAELIGHMKADELVSRNSDKNICEIKDGIEELKKIVRESTQRVHELREQTAEALRYEISVVEKKAQAALDGVSGNKIWTLGGALTALVMFAMWMWDHFSNVPRVK